MKTIQQIREAMQAKGITPYRLSKLTGITEGQLSKYFSGVHTPSIGKIEVMAAALDKQIKVVDLDADKA